MIKNILAMMILVSSQSSFGISKTELSQILAQELQEITQSQSKTQEKAIESKQVVLLNDKTEGFSADADIQIVSFEGN